MNTLKKRIQDAINSMNQNQLINLNNTYCDAINSDSHIYSNDEEFFAMAYPNAGDALKAVQAATFGKYQFHHDWVQFNGYGNLDSFDRIDLSNLCEFPEVIAEYIAENPAEFADLFEFDLTE